jgi:uncharacterized membrane protein YfhO
MQDVKRNAERQSAFYIHDQNALKGNIETGHPVEDVPLVVLRFSPNTVMTRVTAPAELFMVANDNYDRFWTAKVDGLPVPVYRANYTYKAIRLPAGEHVVEWRYDPWPVKVMWIWFYLILGVFIILWLSWNRRGAKIAQSLDSHRHDGPAFQSSGVP